MNLGEVCPWPLLFVLSLGRDVLPILRSTWTPSMIPLLTAFLVMMLTTTWQWNSLQGSLWWRTGQALPLGLLLLVTLLFRSISPKPQDFEQELHGLQVLTWKFIYQSFFTFLCAIQVYPPHSWLDIETCYKFWSLEELGKHFRYAWHFLWQFWHVDSSQSRKT